MKIPLLISSSFLLSICAVCLSTPEESENLSAEQTCGVIFCDDFNGETWNDSWRGDWIQDKNIQVRCENGKLRIFGTTGSPVPVCRDHHEFRFCGLVSQKTVQRNVVVACKMQIRAPFPVGKKRVRYLVHLCGAKPDYFVDTGLAHEPDGREGWLHVPIAQGYPFSHDHNYPFVAANRTPLDEEYTILIEHKEGTNETSAFVIDATGWNFLGEHDVYLSTAQVELKVDTPYDGVDIDVFYDDMRMYPRPESSPVQFVLVKPPFPGFPFPDAEIAFFDEAGSQIAVGTTDQDGEATLLFPRDKLYPLGGKIRVSYLREVVGSLRIQASGVHGLYPGDVWKIDAPTRFSVTGGGYPLGM